MKPLKADELIIGCYVHCPVSDSLDERKEWMEVHKIDTEDFANFTDLHFGIPLNNHWIFDFGGKYINRTWCKIEHHGVIIHFNTFNGYININRKGTTDYIVTKEIQTVHQFQILCFALTGKHLVLNKKS